MSHDASYQPASPHTANSSREKVRALSEPKTYPDPVTRIDVVETHMAWVFLTDTHAYKMKKPVKYDFLDFSTLAAREKVCRDELFLNRRLAPDIYLDVVPLKHRPDGTYRIGGTGELCEWLVLMKRLPNTRMLDQMIALETVTAADVGRLAKLMSDFYRDAERSALTGEEYVDAVERHLAESQAVVNAFAPDLDGDRVADVFNRLERFLTKQRQAFFDVVSRERLVDGHGDLRPEHICLIDPPVIIDCLEFDPGLRQVDPVDELAFLALECMRLGAEWVGHLLLEQCLPLLNVTLDDPLIGFYTAYRACVRARLCVAHLLETDVRSPAEWVPRARIYLEIAERALPA